MTNLATGLCLVGSSSSARSLLSLYLVPMEAAQSALSALSHHTSGLETVHRLSRVYAYLPGPSSTIPM